MKPFRTVSLAGPFVVLLIAACFLGSTTETARAADNACTITSADLDAIGAARTEGLGAELLARKALITRVITCLTADAQSLRADLNAVPVEGDAKNIQTQLSGKLDDAITYYDLEFAKVGEAGIAGTQAIAREILAWREANYAPIAGQVLNLTLWARSQHLFAVAEARARQMRSLVSFLEQAGQNQDLEAAIGNAEALVRKASDENQAAKNALLQLLPPDQSLTLVKHSLASLSLSYQKFFDVSTIIQKLLSAQAP